MAHAAQQKWPWKATAEFEFLACAAGKIGGAFEARSSMFINKPSRIRDMKSRLAMEAVELVGHGGSRIRRSRI